MANIVAMGQLSLSNIQATFTGLFTPGRFAGWGWLIGFMLV